TTGGNILVNADLAGSSVHASTLLLTSGGGITFSAAVGAPAAPFDHHLTANAQQSIDVNFGGQIVLADNRNLALNADLAGGLASSLNLGGGSGSTLLQVGTTNANTGSMTLTGSDITIDCFSDCISTTVSVLGSGSQTLSAALGGITLSANSGPVSVTTGGGGTQTLEANGDSGGIAISGGGGMALLASQGSQSISTSGLLEVASGSSAGAHARVWAETGQSISARALSLSAVSGNDAVLQNNATAAQNASAQTLTLVQTLPGSSGISVDNFGSGTAAVSNRALGTQTISVQDASAVTISGHGGTASMDAAGAQSISITGTDSNALHLGASAALGQSLLSAGGTQSITAGGISLTVGSGLGADAKISAGLNQTIRAGGDINLTGTQDIDSNAAFAAILQTGGSLQDIQAVSLGVRGNAAVQSAGAQGIALSGDLLILSGASSGQSAIVDAQLGQTIAARSLTVTALAGNDALLRNVTSGAQLITISNGGAGTGVEIRNAGAGGVAAVENLGGNQALTVTDSAGITVLGSAGTAKIFASAAQSIQISGSATNLDAENLLVVGDYGSGSGLSAVIAGGNQTIIAGNNAANPGEIQLYAGTASGAHAQISAHGTQSLSTAGQLRLEGSNGGDTTLTGAEVVNTGSGVQQIQAGLIVMDGLSTLQSAGSQSYTLAGGMSVSAGSSAGEHAQVLAASGQLITASAINLNAATGNDAIIANARANGANGSEQRITLNGPSGLFYGIQVVNGGSGTAELANYSNGQQVLTVTNSSGGVRIAGDVGMARIYSTGAQNLTITGNANNDLLVGSCCQSGPAELSAEGAQTIVAGLSGETGGISVHGGAVAANL
ncbi:MAG: hypothetical protein JNJ60_11005, partial [Rhodocyclaceae bacterium]|nr:hypothetical protein [Rhodocyclaceae bacterium]